MNNRIIVLALLSFCLSLNIIGQNITHTTQFTNTIPNPFTTGSNGTLDLSPYASATTTYQNIPVVVAFYNDINGGIWLTVNEIATGAMLLTREIELTSLFGAESSNFFTDKKIQINSAHRSEQNDEIIVLTGSVENFVSGSTGPQHTYLIAGTIDLINFDTHFNVLTKKESRGLKIISHNGESIIVGVLKNASNGNNGSLLIARYDYANYNFTSVKRYEDVFYPTDAVLDNENPNLLNIIGWKSSTNQKSNDCHSFDITTSAHSIAICQYDLNSELPVQFIDIEMIENYFHGTQNGSYIPLNPSESYIHITSIEDRNEYLIVLPVYSYMNNLSDKRAVCIMRCDQNFMFSASDILVDGDDANYYQPRIAKNESDIYISFINRADRTHSSYLNTSGISAFKYDYNSLINGNLPRYFDDNNGIRNRLMANGQQGVYTSHRFQVFNNRLINLMGTRGAAMPSVGENVTYLFLNDVNYPISCEQPTQISVYSSCINVKTRSPLYQRSDIGFTDRITVDVNETFSNEYICSAYDGYRKKSNGIQLKEEINDFTIYPNPNVFNNVTLNVKLVNDENVVIEIFDISGRKVKTSKRMFIKEGDSSVEIDIENIPQGSYNVMIQGDSFVKSKILIINK